MDLPCSPVIPLWGDPSVSWMDSSQRKRVRFRYLNCRVSVEAVTAGVFVSPLDMAMRTVHCFNHDSIEELSLNEVAIRFSTVEGHWSTGLLHTRRLVMIRFHVVYLDMLDMKIFSRDILESRCHMMTFALFRCLVSLPLRTSSSLQGLFNRCPSWYFPVHCGIWMSHPRWPSCHVIIMTLACIEQSKRTSRLFFR